MCEREALVRYDALARKRAQGVGAKVRSHAYERQGWLYFYSSYAYEPTIGSKIDALARVRVIGSWLHKQLDAERKLPTPLNYYLKPESASSVEIVDCKTGSHAYEGWLTGGLRRTHAYERNTFGCTKHTHAYERSTFGCTKHTHAYERSTFGYTKRTHACERGDFGYTCARTRTSA